MQDMFCFLKNLPWPASRNIRLKFSKYLNVSRNIKILVVKIAGPKKEKYVWPKNRQTTSCECTLFEESFLNLISFSAKYGHPV